MKWWIVEDALKDKKGHYFEYVRTFKHGLEELGDEVRVFVDHTAEPWLVEALDAKPVLPRCIWRRMNDGSPRWKKLLRYPVHGWKTLFAIRRMLKQGPLPDIIFFPSVSTHHLLGLVPLLRFYARRLPTKFLLFFPNCPIRYDPLTGVAAPKPDPAAKVFPKLLGHLADLVGTGKAIVGAETSAMKEALQHLSGLSFTYLPHPIPRVPRDRGMSAQSILFGCYGAARYEKGSDLLQRAIHAYLAHEPDSRVRFAIQWLEDFEDGQGNVIKKDPVLLKHPNVTYITDYFPPGDAYLKQVAQTDVMILPYRDSYRFRLSRVVIESILTGIPVIVPEGTTLFEQADRHGVAVSFQMESVDGLTAAIRESVAGIERLSRAALDKMDPAARHFSVATFRDYLMHETERD